MRTTSWSWSLLPLLFCIGTLYLVAISRYSATLNERERLYEKCLMEQGSKSYTDTIIFCRESVK